VALCDRRPPLTLTSDKSTECYRNWWPSEAMVRFMNRSIDLLEELDRISGHAFGLNRRGYLYATADPARLARLEAEAGAAAALGMGALRVHHRADRYRPNGPDGPADGADLLHRAALDRHFGYLSPDTVGALHVRRAGWMSAQQLGAWMLDEARAAGLTVYPAQITGVTTEAGAVTGVELDTGLSIATTRLVAAAGPLLGAVARLAGVELDLHSEVHRKLAFRDGAAAVPRDAPLLIWSDPQHLGWSKEERELLIEVGRPEVAGELPAQCHLRPEGGPGSDWVLGLWEYTRTVVEPAWPLPEDDLFPELVVRGLTRMLPALAGYVDHLPRPVVDGGHYTKTVDNLPLIGPAGPEGFFLCGALSGYGVMAAPAAGELAALHLTGADLPDHGSAFLPSRLADPAYLATVSSADIGQL
jgi:hypothetical protein